MKKITKSFILIVFAVVVIFQNLNFVSLATARQINSKPEFRGTWISFLEFQSILCKKSEKEFESNIDKMFDNIKNSNLTDVIVCVHPFSDALYKSKIFPTSHLLTSTQGDEMSFDPLQIMINKAHERGLKIHAWFNPYRIKNPNSKLVLAEHHVAKKWVDENNKFEIIKTKNGGIYYNPCSENAKQLIVKGVEEVVKNYNVDGVQFDDYFYPAVDESIDVESYKKYVSDGGKLTLNEWRFENVNSLIKNVYSAIKAIKPNVMFGISPDSVIERNYNVHYSDVKKWASEPGYIDYLMPQIYFGFNHSKVPFNSTLEGWCNLSKLDGVKLYIGLACYKIGNEDKFAGVGSKEWINNNNIISQQIISCRKNNCNGFIFYRYDSLFNPEQNVKNAVDEEISSVLPLLKD